MKTEAVLTANELMKTVTMKVRIVGMKRAMFRIRCAIPLIWLASKVAGLGLQVETDVPEGGWPPIPNPLPPPPTPPPPSRDPGRAMRNW